MVNVGSFCRDFDSLLFFFIRKLKFFFAYVNVGGILRDI